MCGISGIISKSMPEAQVRERIRNMGGLQAHRGPDGYDAYIQSDEWGCLGLGFVRLAILDLATGMQPIRCPADGTAIICNGQIYNYIELRQEVADQTFASRGDIEVALHLYRKKGIDFLNLLNGMYAGAIYDPLRRRLFLFRDRFGIKPLYYAYSELGFAFASEIKALFAGIDLERNVNKRQLPTYFVYRYVPGGQTLFSGVRRLPPGSYLEFNLETHDFSVHRYWDYRTDRENQGMTLQDAAETFFALFQDAVKIRLRADVELGSFISGGIDSSAVAAEAVKTHPDMRLYTVTFDEAKYDELPHVKRFLKTWAQNFSQTRLTPTACEKSSLSQLPAIIRAIEEPISLGTILPTDRVCQAAAQNVKAVLTGEGADEIFAGYRKFMLEMAAEEYQQLSERQQKRIHRDYPELRSYLATRRVDPAERYIQSEALFGEAEIKRLTGCPPEPDLFPVDAYPALTGQEHPVNAAIAFESRCRLPDYVVLRLDKLAMRHSLETRTPLLDYRLAEFAAQLPIHIKLNLALNREKFICCYTYVKYGLLDAKSAFRRKQPFTFPMADWLAETETLPGAIQEVLNGDMIKRQNVLDVDFVRKLARTVTAADVGPQTLVSQADRLFSVIIFSMWHQEFMDN